MELKITASIVTYNNENEIESVLKSLILSQIKNFEIYVVDNASTDNTVMIIEQQFKNIHLIKLDSNIGFGAAHNKVLKKVVSKFHIFVNPDILVRKGEIDKMIYYMENNDDTVILTPTFLNFDGTEQFLPKLYPKLKYLVGGYFENSVKKCYKWRSEYTLRDEKIEFPIQIDFCSGAFMFCKTSALKKVNGFDERYFLYFEDADLTRKLQTQGKTMFVPNIYVKHEWNRNNSKLGKFFFISIKSMFKYFWKWRNV